MKHVVEIPSLEAIDAAAREFVDLIPRDRVVALYGQMGAGKTTFTTAVCKALGVEDPVCSPTFTIVNEYVDREGESIYHFDFYRIRNIAEAMDIGTEDYFYSGCLCLVEWPENIEQMLPEDALRVQIVVHDDLSRTVEWEDSL